MTRRRSKPASESSAGDQLALDIEAGPLPEQAEPAPPAPRPVPAARADQLAVIDLGEPEAARAPIPSEVWSALLADEAMRASYERKVFRTAAGCAHWIGSISSTGHGNLRVPRAVRRAAGGPAVVLAHVYGWQLTHGVISARPGEDLVVAHRCDEPACQRPDHWELISRAANTADYLARRHRVGSPLSDVRGVRGRGEAIRAAILQAQATGADVEAAIAAAKAAGIVQAPGLF